MWRFPVSLLIIYFFATSFLLKIKSAPTEADAQKTQTPIVAKLTSCENGYKTPQQHKWSLHFYQIP